MRHRSYGLKNLRMLIYPGKKIGGYQLIKRLGQGRYGVCYLAKDNHQEVVIKRFKKNKLKNIYEAQILAQLEHPGIPKFISLIREKGFYGFVLEKKAGETIQTILFKDKYRFTNFEFYQTGHQLIGILKYLHENGIVHRDLRIPNVIINQNQIALIDFGLARWEDEQHYSRQVDFFNLGDLLLYLLYSNYQGSISAKHPWHEELELTASQKLFLKKLLQLSKPYQSIDEIAHDFEAIRQPVPSSR